MLVGVQYVHSVAPLPFQASYKKIFQNEEYQDGAYLLWMGKCSLL